MPNTFVTVLRPGDKASASQVEHGRHEKYVMDKWLSESVDNQPYNAIAAVKSEPCINNNENCEADCVSQTLAKAEK
ncbi:hypothetical protein FAVG1_08742 [Fusarium avenaceum]|nr:hypothetical protein FAVG1_08742 [Fusarium avenaceum]